MFLSFARALQPHRSGNHAPLSSSSRITVSCTERILYRCIWWLRVHVYNSHPIYVSCAVYLRYDSPDWHHSRHVLYRGAGAVWQCDLTKVTFLHRCYGVLHFILLDITPTGRPEQCQLQPHDMIVNLVSCAESHCRQAGTVILSVYGSDHSNDYIFAFPLLFAIPHDFSINALLDLNSLSNRLITRNETGIIPLTQTFDLPYLLSQLLNYDSRLSYITSLCSSVVNSLLHAL